MARSFWILLLLVVLAGHCFGKDLYVSPYGDDNNDGLTVGTPVLLLSTAFSRSVANDTVHMAKGTYSGSGNTDISISKTNITVIGSGTPKNVGTSYPRYFQTFIILSLLFF